MSSKGSSTVYQKLVVGDLVKFASTFFNDARYANPGVVTGINLCKQESQASYTIIWADGGTTTEWSCYLKKLS
tara:strand:- start:721 stop:939 length:219 start_codon:yes stop_codon:yes gene_type:complete